MTKPESGYFRDRERAESFGSIAATYDRARPSYPDAAIVDIASLGGTDVLDVGCGTGILARLLTSRGLNVLGVEIDPKMAQVARAAGTEVEVGGFEDWDARGRTFDLLSCGQAWHWIDPVAGAAKAGQVLSPGGSLCLLWNVHALPSDVRPAVDAVYERAAPSLPTRSNGNASRGGESRERALPGLEQAGFADVRFRDYDWQQVYSRDDWLALLGTYSDHNTLPREQLSALLVGLGELVDSRGGSIQVDYTTHAVFARRP